MWDLGLYQYCLVSTFKHTNLVLELCPRLIFGRYEAGIYMYIPGIETGIKLVQGWYYLRSLPGWYQYKLVLVQG